MKLRLFAILALLILPLPALAGPREDVTAGASRCTSYADDRQWLDCYYGAAQPMRARLGLAPAAAAQVSLASVARGAAVTAASAVPSFGQHRKSDGGFFSGWFGSGHEDEAPPAEFGQRTTAKGLANDQRPVDHITARMTAYAINKYTGQFVIDLDNGQRWKQLDGDSNLAHWAKKASTYVVTISNGWFGSYNMHVQGQAGVYKVDRVK